jgi:hypothetical protein
LIDRYCPGQGRGGCSNKPTTMMVSLAQGVGTGDKPVERHVRTQALAQTACHARAYVRTDRARVQGMFSVAEPGLSLEAHRRSPVRTAGTKPDSSHRIAATATRPLDARVCVSGQSVIIVIGAAAARTSKGTCSSSEVVVLVLCPSSRTPVIFRVCYPFRCTAHCTLHCNTHPIPYTPVE